MTANVHIACFHRIIPDENEEREWPYITRGTALTISQFKQCIDELATNYQFIDEQIAGEILVANQPGPSQACWVTFDDGYRDILTIAAPILTEYKIKPTLFLTTRLLDGNWHLPVDRWYSILLRATRKRGVYGHEKEPWEFNLDREQDRNRFVKGIEKRQYLEGTPQEQEKSLEQLAKALGSISEVLAPKYLTRKDIQALTDLGWFIGSHGHSHLLLPKCADSELLNEILASESILDRLTIKRSSWFAYSDGVVDPRIENILEQRGCIGAVTTDGKMAEPNINTWETPRFVEHPK